MTEIETILQELREVRAERDSATAQADELDGKLKDAQKTIADRDATIAKLERDLVGERDCVLRQQRELNRLQSQLDMMKGATNKTVLTPHFMK